MMSDQQNSSPLLRKPTHGVPQLPLGGKIQAIAGLVQQKNLRTMHNGSPNQNSFRLSHRHFSHRLVAKVLDFQQMKNLVRPLPHNFRHMEVRPQSRTRKKSGHYCVATCRMRRALSGQLRGNAAQMSAQLGQIPAFSAKDSQKRIVPYQRVALACERLDQGSFSAAIWTQNCQVFVLPNPQRNVVQDDSITPGYGNVFHLDK
jgi:hypothetical protein